ncbi:MAG: lactate racemase [Thermoproteota archaeon]|nr:lactate racemase [Thermoproteota archaeon]
MEKEFKTIFNGAETTVKLPSENMKAVISFHDRPGLKDPEGKMRKLLEDPIGCEKLADIVKRGDKVALISAEYTMMPQTWIVAPVVVDALKKAGVKDEDITLVNAPGTHQTEEQQMVNPLVAKLFGTVSGKYRMVYHDCDKKDKLTYVGETSQGTPVFVNKTVMEADVKIGFNSIPPHHSAGHCGGGKIIMPGVCGRASIGAMHRRVMCPGFREWQVGLPNPKNMVRKDIHDSARLAGLDFCIDVVSNSQGQIIDIFAGDFEKEYNEGVTKVSSKLYGTEMDGRADIAIHLPTAKPMSQGPFADPKYLTGAMLQPLLAADMATKDDGISIIVQSAEGGFDSAGTLGGGFTDVDLTLEARRKRGYVDPFRHVTNVLQYLKMTSDELGWIMAMGQYDLRDASLMWQGRKTLDSKRMFLASLFPKEVALTLGFRYVTPNFDEALKKAFEEKGKDATIAVIQGGRYPIIK